MKRIAIAVLVVAALVTVGAADPIGPAEQKLLDGLPRIDLLPADANCYCYRMGWGELKGKLAGTATLAAVNEPGVQEFFAEVRRMGQRGDKMGPAFSFMVTASFQSLVLAGEPVANEGEKPGTLYGLTVTPSEADRTDFASQIERARVSFEKSGLLPPVRNDSARIQIGSTTFAKNGEDDQVILSAWDGSTLHLAGSDAAAKWLAGLQPNVEKSLARGEMFKSTVGPVVAGQKAGPIALYYHDLRPFWKSHDSPFWQGMSWRSIDALAGASFVEGKGWRNRHYWKLGEKRVGLLAHTKGGSVKQDWLKRIPSDATAFMTGYWSPRSFVLTLGALGNRIAGGDEEDLTGIAQMMMVMGPTLDAVGPRYMYYRVAGKYGALIPTPLSDMVLVLELKDPKAFQDALDGLIGLAGGGVLMPEKITLAGHKVTTMNMTFMTAYFTTAGNDFILTFHPQMMKDALANWNKPPAESVLDTPAWKAASGKLVADPCFIFYIAPNGFIRGIYDRYIPVLQQFAGMMLGFERAYRFGPAAERPVDPEKTRGFRVELLPRGSDMGRHVTEATILSAHDDGAGVLFDGYAPMLSGAYYWTGLAASIRPFNFGPQSLMFLLQYIAMPAEVEGGPAVRAVEVP